MRRVPLGTALILLLIFSTATLVLGAMLLLRPDWLGFSSERPRADSLVASVIDSLPLPSPWDELHEQLRMEAARAAALLDSLHRLRHRADSLQAELEQLRTELRARQQQWHARADSLRQQHYEAFAKIYNNAPPEDVARILEQLPPQEAAQILKAMNRRQAARVVAALPARHAAAALTSSAHTAPAP